MHPRALCLTTALLAALLALPACNKSATPTAPANAPAIAATAATAPPAATPAPPAASPAPLAAAPMAAGSGGERPGKKIRQACAADIAKFCTAGEKPRQCLKPHAAELSPTCQAARSALGGGGKVKMACAAEIAKFCTAGEMPFKCLKPHAAELSQGCQAARAAQKAAHQARMGGQAGE